MLLQKLRIWVKATFFAVPAKVDFHDILTSLSLSLSLSVFFFSTSVKNNIIFYKFAVHPKRAKHVQITKKDIKVLPWLGICFLIKFFSRCSVTRIMAFPQVTDIRLIMTDTNYSRCLLYILVQTKHWELAKILKVFLVEYCWTDPLKEIG